MVGVVKERYREMTRFPMVGREGGLLDRSIARYFNKRLRTSLHKITGNLLVNLFSKKCAFKNNLQLLQKKFLSQTKKHLKMAFYLSKWPVC